MNSFDNVIYAKNRGLSAITINRPEVRNALDKKTREELKIAVDLAAEDETVRVVVISGAGESSFCSGADLNELLDLTPKQAREYVRISRAVTETIHRMEKPVISAVNGYALGGGFELAMACDLVVASETARFGQPEIGVGLIPGGGATQRLPRLLGIRRATELIFTGRLIDAEEAQSLGLVNTVVPEDQLDNAVALLAETLLEMSPLTLALAKSCLGKSQNVGLRSGMEYELEVFSLCCATEDQKEGARAFLEKRQPRFRGR